MVVQIYKCKRCGHEWAGRKKQKPVTCPNPDCRSPYWERERNKTK